MYMHICIHIYICIDIYIHTHSFIYAYVSSILVIRPPWLGPRPESLTEGLGRGFCNTTKGNLYADNMWASRQYVCPQSLIMDRFLYDRENHTWTVHRFLQDFKRRYGGLLGTGNCFGGGGFNNIAI